MRVYLLLMLIAMGLTVTLTPLVRWVSLRWGLVPKLRSRDIQKTPISRLGGVAMTIAFDITVLVASRIPFMAPLYETQVPWTIMVGATALCFLGVVDDLVELDWMTKMAGQILIVGMMALNGVQMVSFPIFGLTIGSSRLSLLVTIFVVVGIINAVNFIDGLDGLAAGVVGIGALAFFFYSYLLARLTGASSYATTAALIVIVLVGVCAGFLWFNFHPASIMMGGGAETLGLILASAGIVVTGQIDPAVLGNQQVLAGLLPIILPLAVIFIPLADLVVTSTRRLARGQSPFHADRSHFHDRLLARGHSHRGVVMILYLWTAVASFPAVGLLAFSWQRVLPAFACAAIIALVLTASEFPLRLWARSRGGHIRSPK